MDGPEETPQEAHEERLETAPAPWDAVDVFPEKPQDSEYGYLAGGRMVPCTREELIEQCSRDHVRRTSLVWTPEEPRLVMPAEVPFLFDALRQRTVHRFRRRLVLGCLLCGVAAAGLVTHYLGEGGLDFGGMMFLLLGGLLAYGSARVLKQIGAFTRAQAWASRRLLRYTAWLDMRRTPLTLLMTVCISVVFLLELWRGVNWSVWAGGLRKDWLRQGVIYTMFTSPMLHAHTAHIVFNGLALIWLGRQVEGLANSAHMAIVLLLSALWGGVFSYYFTAAQFSVGLSGGLLGLVGYLGVLGYLRKDVLPVALYQTMVRIVFYTALLGFAAYGHIDNAGHLGGLVCGALLGLALMGERDRSIPVRAGAAVRIAGWISGALLVAMAALTARVILWELLPGRLIPYIYHPSFPVE